MNDKDAKQLIANLIHRLRTNLDRAEFVEALGEMVSQAVEATMKIKADQP